MWRVVRVENYGPFAVEKSVTSAEVVCFLQTQDYCSTVELGTCRELGESDY